MNRKRIDWTNHLIELIVVFIGITLAFMLNNWRESYNDRQLEKKYLMGFLDEINQDFTELISIINLNNEKLGRVKQFINNMRSGTIPADTILVVIGDMVQIHQFFPKMSTFETIKNSGNLGIITDYELKELLITYYQSFETKKLQENYYNLYINEYVIPFVYKNVDFLEQKIINPNAAKNHEFNNLILGYYQLLVQLNDDYKEIHDMNKVIKKILE